MFLPEEWIETIRLIDLQFDQTVEAISVMSGVPREALPRNCNDLSDEGKSYLSKAISGFPMENVKLWMEWRNKGCPKLVKSQTVEEFLSDNLGITVSGEEICEPEASERVPTIRSKSLEKAADRLARHMAYLRKNPDWDAVDPISRDKLYTEAFDIVQTTFSEDEETRILEIATLRAKRRNHLSWADTPRETQEWLLDDARAIVALGFDEV